MLSLLHAQPGVWESLATLFRSRMAAGPHVWLHSIN